MRNLKRALSLGLTAAMISGLMVMGSSAASYADVTSENNVEAIEVLESVGIMIGDESGNFNPDQNVTRNEMAVVMSNLMEYNVASYKDTSPFTDVPSWAEPYVAACYTNGITAGISATTYGGSDTVTTAQAALMLMKALGYFQYSSDFGADWQLATVKQGNNIDLFVGVDSGVTQAMTRNDVAQLVLNTLEAGTVQASTDGSISIGNVTINTNVSYDYITSNQSYASAIDSDRRTNNDGDLVSGYIVELGEQLYMGDLKLNDDATDVFGRPARYWEYDSEEIGTYAKTELLKQEYTTEVTGRDLYDLLGSNVVDNYNFSIYIDGIDDPDINSVLFDETAINRNNRDGVGTGADATGNGALTQVYVDTDEDVQEVTIAIINTYLAKANSDYNENRDELALTVYNLADDNDDNLLKDNADDVTLRVDSEDFPMVEDAVEGDFFLVTVADGAIQTMAEPEVLAGAEISGFQTRNDNNEGNLTADGTRYEYSFTARYDVDTLNNYTTVGNSNLKDTTYNIYMDPYGYVIGVEEVDAEDNYVFITGVDSNYSNLSARTLKANAIFPDGRMETITINRADSDMPTLDNVGAAEEASVLNTWYTYSVNSADVYTVQEVGTVIDADHDVAQWKDPERTDSIDDEHIRLDGNNADGYSSVYGNDNSIYLTASITEIEVADDATAIVIDDVDSVATGIDNVNIDPWDYVAATPAAHDQIVDADTEITGTDMSAVEDSGYVSAGVYTLYDEDGYVIAAVVVGDDGGTATDFVFVHSSRVAQESYDTAAEEWTWTRNVIIDGEEVTIREVNDTEMSYLEDMNRYTWYRVRYNAEGDVIDADAVPAGNYGADAGFNGGVWGTLTDAAYYDAIQDVTNDIEAGTSDTIIYFAGDGSNGSNDFTNVGSVPYVDARSLYVSRSYDGVRITEDVNVVFIQTADNRTNTEYTSGVSNLEDALDELNRADDNTYSYEIAMVVEGGRATSVIIRDLVADGDSGQQPVSGVSGISSAITADAEGAEALELNSDTVALTNDMHLQMPMATGDNQRQQILDALKVLGYDTVKSISYTAPDWTIVAVDSNTGIEDTIICETDNDISDVWRVIVDGKVVEYVEDGEDGTVDLTTAQESEGTGYVDLSDATTYIRYNTALTTATNNMTQDVEFETGYVEVTVNVVGGAVDFKVTTTEDTTGVSTAGTTLVKAGSTITIDKDTGDATAYSIKDADGGNLVSRTPLGATPATYEVTGDSDITVNVAK